MTIEVVHEAMNRAKADVRVAASELRSTRMAIDRRISGFLEHGWTGIAAQSYLTPWADWLDGATDLEEGLVATAELLDALHKDLIAQDEQSQQRLDAISSRIIERLG